MKFLIEVITTGFKFSSPKCGTEQLKTWGGGRKELKTHVVCIKTPCKSGRCVKGISCVTELKFFPHFPSVSCK